jgi:hypothetical protein
MNNSVTSTDNSSTFVFSERLKQLVKENWSSVEPRRIVINSSHGGFTLSDKALSEYRTLADIPMTEPLREDDIQRDDIFLVQVVERLKDEANGRWSKLKIVEIPAHVEWIIQEYDGDEWVAEKHRVWS